MAFDEQHAQTLRELAALRKRMAALEAAAFKLLEWDRKRNFIVPYSVRDPIIAVLNSARNSGVRPVAGMRKATDEEIAAWAQRHDLDCWDDLTKARDAFEDAETHHLTRADGVRVGSPAADPQCNEGEK